MQVSFAGTNEFFHILHKIGNADTFVFLKIETKIVKDQFKFKVFIFIGSCTEMSTLCITGKSKKHPADTDTAIKFLLWIFFSFFFHFWQVFWNSRESKITI